jgi:mRNA interferase MazF
VKRGEIWSVAGGPDYTGKPRPAVIIQDDSFDATRSITICALTTTDLKTPRSRPRIEPTQENGLRAPSFLMGDKVATVPRSKLGTRIGAVAPEDMKRIDTALRIFLGLAV